MLASLEVSDEGGTGVNLARGGSPDGDEQSSMQMMYTKTGDLSSLGLLRMVMGNNTVVVGPSAAETVVQRSMFLEVVVEETEVSKSGKGFQGVGGENIKNHGQQVMSVRTPDCVVRKSTWQVADVRRPLVSASHIIQAGSDALHFEELGLQIETTEKGETDAEEGGQCPCIRLVRESSCWFQHTDPVQTMEIDAINQVTDGSKRRRRVTFACSEPGFQRRAP